MDTCIKQSCDEGLKWPGSPEHEVVGKFILTGKVILS